MSHIYIIDHVDPHLVPHLYYIQVNMTPLHDATMNCRTATVQLLLQAGADIDFEANVSTY